MKDIDRSAPTHTAVTRPGLDPGSRQTESVYHCKPFPFCERGISAGLQTPRLVMRYCSELPKFGGFPLAAGLCQRSRVEPTSGVRTWVQLGANLVTSWVWSSR